MLLRVVNVEIHTNPPRRQQEVTRVDDDGVERELVTDRMVDPEFKQYEVVTLRTIPELRLAFDF